MLRAVTCPSVVRALTQFEITYRGKDCLVSIPSSCLSTCRLRTLDYQGFKAVPLQIGYQATAARGSLHQVVFLAPKQLAAQLTTFLSANLMCDNLSTTQRDEVEMSSDTNQWGNWEVEMSDETIRSLLRIKSTSLESSGPLFAPPEPPNSTTVVPDNALSPEQTAILKLVQSGRSIFFTGSAGVSHS